MLFEDPYCSGFGFPGSLLLWGLPKAAPDYKLPTGPLEAEPSVAAVPCDDEFTHPMVCVGSFEGFVLVTDFQAVWAFEADLLDEGGESVELLRGYRPIPVRGRVLSLQIVKRGDAAVPSSSEDDVPAQFLVQGPLLR